MAWSLASTLTVSRRSEVGVLRALGWRAGEVRWSFALQVGLLGAVVGVVAGLVVALVSVVLGGVSMLPGSAVVWVSPSPLVLVVVLVGLPVVVGVGFGVGTLPVVQRLVRLPVDGVLRDTRG